MESFRTRPQEISREQLDLLLAREPNPSYTIEDLGEVYRITLPKRSVEDGSIPLKKALELLERENADHRPYIPLRLFYKHTSKQAIYRSIEIPSIPKVQREEVTERIFQDGRKILATLILIDRVDLVLEFIQHVQLQDLKLPFELKVLETFIPHDAAKRFYKEQWMFLSPVFSLGTLTDTVQGQMALPYLRDKRIGEGSFGTVYEIEVDQDHIGTEGLFSGKLVRKELKQEDHTFELENLAILNHLHHPNILRLLTSYVHVENEHKNKYNLVFPFANGGTLAQLLEKDRQTTPFTSDGTILLALSGLSSALEHVHEFTDKRLDLALVGLHHDFRPRNVLISGLMFVLADFGLSRFKDANVDSGTPFRPGGDDYDPPEGGNLPGEQTGKIHRLSEVWVFGCILANILTWMKRGPEGIREFQKQRTFQVTTRGTSTYTTFHCGRDKPNEGVGPWLNGLPTGGSESIEQLVQLIHSMLTMERSRRPTSQVVTVRLRIITLLNYSEQVEHKFISLLEADDVEDTFLEYKRFQAWMYVISNVKDPEQMADACTSLTAQNFQSILQNLQTLKRQLDSDSMQSPIGIKMLIHLIDSLVDRLTGDQQETLQKRLLDSLIQVDDKTLQDHLGGASQIGQLDKAVRMRRALTHATQLFEEHSATELGFTHLDSNSITPSKDFGQHKLGAIECEGTKVPVLIEWRRYGRNDSSKGTIKKQLHRVERLTRLLSVEKPEELRSLPCRGFFHNTTDCRFGAVF
ncbi:kinase-like domain-containing protein [Annulohypoxylon nitens]|nr:kinase-like domain-containing protein [Annulohypoxylon nitens]